MKSTHSYGLHLYLVYVVAGILHTAGYECNYNASGPIQPIRPGVGEFGPIQSVNYPNGYGAYRSFCQVQIEACYGCTIQLRFEEAILAPCQLAEVATSTSGSCDVDDMCEYFIWSETGHPPRRLVGNLTSFAIEAEQSVTLSFCYSGRLELYHPHDYGSIHRWKAIFAIRDQFTYRYLGSAKQSGPNPAPRSGLLRSPGFPYLYAENHTTYFIQGIMPSDRIRIVFDDFDIDPIASSLKIYDGPERSESNSHTFRTRDDRPVFTSKSQYILIEFFPGDRGKQPSMHMGFKATYEYIHRDSVSELPNPVHHKCTSVRPAEGGVVLQVGPSPGSAPVYHDCVWSLPTHFNLHMSVHMIQFKLSEVPFSKFPLLRQLEIRDAFHSDGKVLTILYSESQLPLLKQEDLSSKGGLYVRLRATLSDDSIVRFSYTPYRRELRSEDLRMGNSCNLEHGATGFQKGVLCNHDRETLWCIPAKLACDNLTHCSADSDETLPMCQGSSGKLQLKPLTPAEEPDYKVQPQCKPPLYRCLNGRCVKKRIECHDPGRVCEAQGMELCAHPAGRCYKLSQSCDGHNDCGDWSDETNCNGNRPDHRLSVFVQSLGNTWFFFLPAVILVLTFVVGCVVYKTRKFRQWADSEGYIGAATDDVQLHTFTVAAPPPYEEIVPAPISLNPPTGPQQEREPPPPYEEIAPEMNCSVNQDASGAAAPHANTNFTTPAPPGTLRIDLKQVGMPANLLYRVGGPTTVIDGAAAAGALLDEDMTISKA